MIYEHAWILVPAWAVALLFHLLYTLCGYLAPAINTVVSYTIKMVDYILPKSITNKSKEDK